MAARLLLRRFLVGNSEYGLPAESMGTLGGTQNRKCRKRVGWKCQGILPRQRQKIGGRNPVLESSSHLGGACRSLYCRRIEARRTLSC